MKQSKTIIAQMLRMACLLLLCVIIAPAFVSCGSHDEPDNDKAEKSIVGVWRHDFEDGYQMLTLSNKGGYTLVEIDYVSGNWSETGTYDVKGNILNVYINKKTGIVHEVYTILTLTETKLITRYEGYFGEEYDGGYFDDDYAEFYRVE